MESGAARPNHNVRGAGPLAINNAFGDTGVPWMIMFSKLASV